MDSHDATEELHRFNEVDPFFKHNDVDGIKVPFTTEAASKVGFRVGGRVEVRAVRTQEAEISLPDFTGDPQDIADEPVNGDVVAKFAEMVGMVTSVHGFTCFRWKGLR